MKASANHFSYRCDQTPDRSNLKDESFILAHGSGDTVRDAGIPGFKSMQRRFLMSCDRETKHNTTKQTAPPPQNQTRR